MKYIPCIDTFTVKSQKAVALSSFSIASLSGPYTMNVVTGRSVIFI